MDVRLSAEQQSLRESAARVVDRLGPSNVRALDDHERVLKLAAAVDAAGWLEMRSPVEGTLPLASGVESAIVAEELGRGLADTPFIGPILAADLRLRLGFPAPRSAETVALTSDLSALSGSPSTKETGSALALEVYEHVPALLLQRSGDVTVLAQVSASPGWQGVDLTRPVAPVDAHLAVPLDGADYVAQADLRSWTALGLSLACADLVGVMRGAIPLAVDYASQRRQYGVSIGSFQAVQHMLADAQVGLEGSRSVALHAAWAVDALPPDEALAAASVAKAFCGRAARQVCETVVQVHGGIGNTWDCLAHVFLRRALLSIDLLGGIGASLARVLEHEGVGGVDGLP